MHCPGFVGVLKIRPVITLVLVLWFIRKTLAFGPPTPLRLANSQVPVIFLVDSETERVCEKANFGDRTMHPRIALSMQTVFFLKF